MKRIKPRQAPIKQPSEGRLASGVVTFQREGPTSLAPLTLADMEEFRSSMAAEGFVIPEKRFKRLVEEVQARMADGSVPDAIRQARQWLATSMSGLEPSSQQDSSATPDATAKNEAPRRPKSEPDTAAIKH